MIDKKTFISELNNNKTYEYHITLSYLSNILYDISRNKIPYYKDIICFYDALNMKDSLNIVKNYIKILEYGLDSIYTLKLQFIVLDIIKEQQKRNKKGVNPIYRY